MSGQPIDMRPDHAALVRNILMARLPEGVRVWAFGSRAKWLAKPYSDLDLALDAADCLPDALIADLKDEFRESDLPWKVDVLDLNAIAPSFRRLIDKDRVEFSLRKKWQKCTLGDVVIFQRGFDLPVQDRKDGPYPVIASTGQVGSHNEPRVKGPGIVIGRSGSIGGGQFIESDFWPLNTTLWVKNFYQNDIRFCFYRIKGLDFSGFNVGSGVPTLNRNHIHPLPICIPRIQEQRAIASVLGSLDDKIELNRRMNETLEAMARAIFRDWFVDFGPTRAKMALSANGAKYNQARAAPYLAPEIWELFPDRLGEDGVPLGWEISEIGKETKVVGGSTPSTKEPRYWGGAINWATPKDLSALKSPVLFETNRKITEGGLEKISSGRLPAGTVLLSSRAPIGYVAVAAIPVAVNQGFIAMRCEGRLSNTYVWLWVHESMELIKGNANGSTFQEISKKNFRPLRVVVPSDDVMRAFTGIVLPLYELIEINELESRTLAQTRDLLLPKLMSGEIRVRAAGAMVEDAG